jgi:signal transduction histidine kinase
MISRHFKQGRFIWSIIFILGVLAIGLLVTGWNVILVQNYYRMIELAHTLARPETSVSSPWFTIALGSLGFVVALGMIILFFVRLLQEIRLNQLQTEFLARVTHELKTPIATLELSSGLIREGGLSKDEVARLWCSHDRELARLKEDVEALLEAARMQIVRPPSGSVSVALESWLLESLERWRSVLGPGAVLERRGDPLPANSSLDPRVLNLIVDNILSNSKKFARGNPSVIVKTSRIPGGRLFRKPRWRIEFQDHGWGFDPKDRNKIFERFSRVRHGAPYSIAGTGLGLFLARSASRTLGLRLFGESPGNGKGCTFVLEGAER